MQLEWGLKLERVGYQHMVGSVNIQVEMSRQLKVP
jgi:hypothetical protein